MRDYHAHYAVTIRLRLLDSLISPVLLLPRSWIQMCVVPLAEPSCCILLATPSRKHETSVSGITTCLGPWYLP